MAKSDKSKETDQVEDVAEELEEVIEAELDDEPAQEEADEVVEDAQIVEDPIDEDAHDATPEPTVTDAPSQTTIVKKGGFFSMVLGGIVAAGLGFVAGKGDLIPNQYLPEFLQGSVSNSADLMAEQSAQIDALRAQIEDMASNAPDYQSAIDTVGAATAQLETNLNETRDELIAKIDGIEIPPATGSGSAPASGDIAALREIIESQNAKIAEIAAQAQEQMNSTQATVAQLEADAVAEAKAAEARSALGRIQASLQTGDGFEAALADLQAASDAEVAPALVAAASSGVSSVAALSDSFPDYARAALAAARSSDDGTTDTGGRLAAFIARQTGARSVEPREGSDPDAVLSRAEAAVRNGALTDAFAEIETLPEPARVELADWIAQAQARVNAVAAANALSDVLKSN